MACIQVLGDGDRLLSRKEASRELAELGIQRSPATLAKIFCTRQDGPPCRHLGRTPYYLRSELLEWASGSLSTPRRYSKQQRSVQG